MVLCSYTIDLVLDGAKQSYQIMIFSQKADEISDAIVKEIGRGVTIVDAKGGYTHKDQKVLIVIAHKTDKQNIMHVVGSLDPDAFFSVAKAQGVYGRNFEKLKL